MALQLTQTPSQFMARLNAILKRVCFRLQGKCDKTLRIAGRSERQRKHLVNAALGILNLLSVS